MKKWKLGRLGEKNAVKYLLDHGYLIKEKNYRIRRGEIDIIVTKLDWLIFVEVKTRDWEKCNSLCPPRIAVDFKKRQKIKFVAQHYLMTQDLQDMKIRFDVIEVYFRNNNYIINHLKNAF